MIDPIPLSTSEIIERYSSPQKLPLSSISSMTVSQFRNYQLDRSLDFHKNLDSRFSMDSSIFRMRSAKLEIQLNPEKFKYASIEELKRLYGIQ